MSLIKVPPRSPRLTALRVLLTGKPAEPARRCPLCAEPIQPAAVLCRWCYAPLVVKETR